MDFERMVSIFGDIIHSQINDIEIRNNHNIASENNTNLIYSYGV